MSECRQSLMDRKDKVISRLTLRVIELEDELASAWDAAHYYELGESRLVDRCLKAEGREVDAAGVVDIITAVHPRS